MKNNQDTSSSPAQPLHDLQALVSEAEGILTGSASEHSSDAVHNLRARFDAAQERFADLCAGTKQKVVAGARLTDTTIRENPYQSLAIAAGIGLAIGVLLGRRSK